MPAFLHDMNLKVFFWTVFLGLVKAMRHCNCDFELWYGKHLTSNLILCGYQNKRAALMMNRVWKIYKQLFWLQMKSCFKSCFSLKVFTWALFKETKYTIHTTDLSHIYIFRQPFVRWSSLVLFLNHQKPFFTRMNDSKYTFYAYSWFLSSFFYSFVDCKLNYTFCY